MSDLDNDMQLEHWDGKLLSPRQREVCALIVEGLTSREIAERLQITVHTVKAHRAEIMDRMGVDSIAELVRHWIAGKVMSSAPTAAAEGTHLSPHSRILLVGSEVDTVTHAIATGLQNLGHAIWTLDSLNALREGLRSYVPQSVIVDLDRRSEHDNALTLTELKKQHLGGIITLSSRAGTPDRVKAMMLGADYHLAKPISLNELDLVIRSLRSRVNCSLNQEK